MVQLNLPPVAGEKVAAMAPEGAKVQAMAMSEPPRRPRGQGGPPRGQDGPNDPNGQAGPDGQDGQGGPPDGRQDADKPDHKVYRLVSITTADGKTIDLATKPNEAQVEGTIKRLNYDRGGRVNGAILDNGELVIFDPSANSTLKLQPGQKLTADGTTRQVSGGAAVLEAKTVNGTEVPQQRRGPGGPGGGGQHGGPPGGPQGGDGGGPPGGGPTGGTPGGPDAR